MRLSCPLSGRKKDFTTDFPWLFLTLYKNKNRHIFYTVKSSSLCWSLPKLDLANHMGSQGFTIHHCLKEQLFISFFYKTNRKLKLQTAEQAWESTNDNMNLLKLIINLKKYFLHLFDYAFENFRFKQVWKLRYFEK